MSSNRNIIETSRGNVVAIGELYIIKSVDFPYEIPRLSFIIMNDAKNSFVSTCIDFYIDGDGATLDEAKNNMCNNIYDFLLANFSNMRQDGPAWSHLESLVVIDEASTELWNAFTMFRYALARQGKKTDISPELYEFMLSFKEKIDTLSKHDMEKENLISQMQTWISEQNKEITRLNQEILMLKGTLAHAMVYLYSKRSTI